MFPYKQKETNQKVILQSKSHLLSILIPAHLTNDFLVVKWTLKSIYGNDKEFLT